MSVHDYQPESYRNFCTCCIKDRAAFDERMMGSGERQEQEHILRLHHRGVSLDGIVAGLCGDKNNERVRARVEKVIGGQR